ncbi:MAG: DUF4431 domain-containing protein [Pyrinomonadaceae bacterium]|nr:DUF4431 domain-containing protein [Pyrinomonadaceae bacterium]
MRATLLLCLIALFCIYNSSTASGERQACLSYEPTVVTLAGRITKHIFPGPPNYESVRRGDAPETTWVLHLARPVCIERGQDEIDEREEGVMDLQLALEPAEYTRYRNLLNQVVVVRGKLFHSHTGHHHTKVLLDVNDIKRNKR